MIGQRFGMFVACLVFLAPQGSAQNLAQYRDFEFGMTVDSVMKRTKSEPSSMKTLYTKPELIQTLQWNRKDYFSPVRQMQQIRSAASALIFMKIASSGSLRCMPPGSSKACPRTIWSKRFQRPTDPRRCQVEASSSRHTGLRR